MEHKTIGMFPKWVGGCFMEQRVCVDYWRHIRRPIKKEGECERKKWHITREGSIRARKKKKLSYSYPLFWLDAALQVSSKACRPLPSRRYSYKYNIYNIDEQIGGNFFFSRRRKRDARKRNFLAARAFDHLISKERRDRVIEGCIYPSEIGSLITAVEKEICSLP